jgi:hypothetical protein
MNEIPVQNFDPWGCHESTAGLESSRCNPSGMWLAVIWPADSLRCAGQIVLLGAHEINDAD